MEEALKKAYRAGFDASGEGYNGEYPFRDNGQSPETDKDWVAQRDKEVQEILAEQPAQIAGFDVVLDSSMPPNEMKFVQPAQQDSNHVATVSEVHLSRYTLEWVNGPLPEGAKLYDAPQPPAQQEPVAGVVLRDGQPTLLQDKHIKETDERLFRAAPPPSIA